MNNCKTFINQRQRPKCQMHTTLIVLAIVLFIQFKWESVIALIKCTPAGFLSFSGITITQQCRKSNSYVFSRFPLMITAHCRFPFDCTFIVLVYISTLLMDNSLRRKLLLFPIPSIFVFIVFSFQYTLTIKGDYHCIGSLNVYPSVV